MNYIYVSSLYGLYIYTYTIFTIYKYIHHVAGAIREKGF